MSELMSFFPKKYETKDDWMFFVQSENDSDKRAEKPKCPVLLMGSVKGGSSKTYNTLSLATALTNYYYSEGLNGDNGGAPVCVIDLDLSATNMAMILNQLDEYLIKVSEGSDRMSFDQTKIDIHRYIIRSAAENILLQNVMATIEYEPRAYRDKSGVSRRIDVIYGTQDSRIRRLFSDNRVEAYENIVHEQEARILLMGLLDMVIDKNYQAIIIDMQPGMEGLCHAAMEYFAKSGSPEPIGNGPKNSKLKKLYERYEAHLCMCCTNDMTQLNSNLEWVQRNWDLCRRLSHRHLLIKDNAQFFEEWFSVPKGSSNQWERASNAYNKWLSIKNMIESKLETYDASNKELKNIFDSMMIATHNEAYMYVLCGEPVGIPNLKQWQHFDQIMVKNNTWRPEYDFWMRHALLNYEWKEVKDE